MVRCDHRPADRMLVAHARVARARRLIRAGLCAGLVAGCDSSTAPVGASRFAPLAADSLFVGKTLGVVTLSTLDGAAITAAPQTWMSSDTNVAVVVAGRVFALGVGTADITAELEGHINTARVRIVPLWLDGGDTFARTSTGYWANCAITLSGGVVCRSRSDSDSLRGFAEAGSGAPPLADLHVAEPHQCGLTSEGAMYCRGWNTHGQFGRGDTTGIRQTTFVAAGEGDLRFSAATAGGSGMGGHTCGIRRADSLLFCFGANDVGQSGQDTAQLKIVSPSVAGDGFRAADQRRTAELRVLAGRKDEGRRRKHRIGIQGERTWQTSLASS